MTQKKNVNCSLFESLLAHFQHPQRQSLSYLGNSFTQTEILDEIYRVKNYLDSKGIKKGDIVSVMLPNVPAFVFAFYGISAAGATVSLIPTFTSILQLKNQLRKTKAKIVFIWDVLYNAAKDMLDELKVDAVVCSMKDYADKKYYPHIEKKFNVPTYATDTPLTYNDLLCPKSNKGYVRLTGKEPAVHISTTGTTDGDPKLVTLSSYKVQTCVFRYHDDVLIKRFKIQNYGTALVDLQFACGVVFAYGMHLLLCYKKLVILPPELPELKLPMFSEYEVNFYFTHQNIVNKIIELDKGKWKTAFSHLKYFNLNLFSQPGTLREKIRALLPNECIYADSYGLTELGCVIYQRYNDDVGYQIFGGKHIIRDVDSNTTAAPYHNKKGELLISSSYTMDGYYGNEEATKKCYTVVNGRKYLLTGDIGYLDEEGCFYFVDRIKRMDKIGGYSIFPAETETIIKTIYNVVNCIVARKLDTNGKHYLSAYLQVEDETEFDKTVVKAQNTVLAQLNRFYVPMKFMLVDEIKRTPMGKNDYKYYEGLND